MRAAALLVAFLFTVAPALGQLDSVRVVPEGGVAREGPSDRSQIVGRVPGDTVFDVRGKLRSFYMVLFDSSRVYLNAKYLVGIEATTYIERMRDEGYSLVLEGHYLDRNSADGVSVALDLRNISKEKVIKYADIEWQLFNSVGDPVKGEHGTPSVTTTRFVGPLSQGETASVEFENVWYNSVGSCAVVRRIDVEHVDGSTFTYINDLQDISKRAGFVNLRGECRYEAQNN